MRKSIFKPENYDIRDALAVFDDDAIDLRRFSLRADDGEFDDIPGYDAYAATWNTVDSHGTFFTKGAFKRSILHRSAEIPVLWQHWPDQPIGTHLEIREDNYGLFVRTKLIEGVQAADEALALLRGGVKLGKSFGFKTNKDRPATDEDELDFSVAPEFKKYPRNEIRGISEVALWETSPVTFASNTKAAPSKIRELIEADSLNALVDAIRTGLINEGQYAQIEAAWSQRPGPAADAPHSTPEQARRNRDIDVSVALRKMEGLLSGDYTWA